MYVLRGHIGRRGFFLEKAEQCIFETHHSYGIMPNSFVTLGADNINIRIRNLVGDKWNIFKNGYKIGNLDFSHYLYSTITLDRKDGSTDLFKLEEEGYSQAYVLSKSNMPIIKFVTSLNPLLIDDKFTLEVLSYAYPSEVIEELIYYAGEILYRKVRPNSGRFF